MVWVDHTCDWGLSSSASIESLDAVPGLPHRTHALLLPVHHLLAPAPVPQLRPQVADTRRSQILSSSSSSSASAATAASQCWPRPCSWANESAGHPHLSIMMYHDPHCRIPPNGAPDLDHLLNDFDDENVSSPGNSSTASGPVYVRPAGFKYHAQQVTQTALPLSPPTSQLHAGTDGGLKAASARVPDEAQGSSGNNKKKKKELLCPDFSLTSTKIQGVRARSKKEPLPMKQRALPQSFWQQPNVAHSQPPGTLYSTLPPLSLGSQQDEAVLADGHHADLLAPVRADSEAQARAESPLQPLERYVTAANTDLLFSLFNAINHEHEQRRIHLVRRGRPKKLMAQIPAHRIIRDDDPYLNCAATQSLLPLIPERKQQPLSTISQCRNTTADTSRSNAAGSSSEAAAPKSVWSTCTSGSPLQATQVIRMLSISNGDRMVELPWLNVEHNYPHLLAQLVTKL